jgi:predicted DNA-binding transcriptional regulator YafY
VNRTDRLYALVEELRAVSPRPRSARWLADRFEVSTRTVERDLSALQQSGVPIYAEPGRTGGYVLDRGHTLPPLNVTPAEATAIAIALSRQTGTPFPAAARSALRKVIAAMPPDQTRSARELAERIILVDRGSLPDGEPVPSVLADAVLQRRVLRLHYVDRDGVLSERVVEPAGFAGADPYWYLVAWCRLRNEPRCFRTDRVLSAEPTGERSADRPYADLAPPVGRFSLPALPGVEVVHGSLRKHRQDGVADAREGGSYRRPEDRDARTLEAVR